VAEKLICVAGFALLAIACSEGTSVHLQATFGITEYLPLSPARTKAEDYVANAEAVVPDVVRNCGGKDVEYRVMTDGAASVDFTVAHSAASAEKCIKAALPRVIVRPTTVP